MTPKQAGTAVLLVASYLLLCLLLRWGQTRLMFFPSAQIQATPATVQLSYQEVWLSASRGQVQGWWIPAVSQTAPVVLYLHGNGSNLGDLVNRAARLHGMGAAVFLIDYRGYGRSWGVFPSETSVYEDAAAAWQYLTQTRQISAQQVVLYGQSIGGAVAIEIASRHPDAAGIIVESSFTSMRAMVTRSVLEFLLPIDWILTQQFDSLTKVRSLQVPILLIHGTADQTIPAPMSQALFAAAPEPKRLLLIPNADHDNVAQMGGALYLQEVEAFIRQVTE
ncbi:MAG: alpha/beta hydrolase [Cyanobacteria bacterium RM1_2_2]|nr:alpha/beta hydrolase [Cyanobacteria bacterium RM1_2_2]